MACGKVRISHSPWVGGTSVSLTPYQTATGTVMAPTVKAPRRRHHREVIVDEAVDGLPAADPEALVEHRPDVGSRHHLHVARRQAHTPRPSGCSGSLPRLASISSVSRWSSGRSASSPASDELELPHVALDHTAQPVRRAPGHAAP